MKPVAEASLTTALKAACVINLSVTLIRYMMLFTGELKASAFQLFSSTVSPSDV